MKHKAHQAAWLTINVAHRAAQCTKIHELETKCKTAKDAEYNVYAHDAAGDDSMDSSATSLTALQAQVAQLLAQLATLGVQPAIVATVSTDVDASVDELPFQSTPIVPGLSNEEKAARIAHAATVQGKGKGKGTETSVANPGLLY